MYVSAGVHKCQIPLMLEVSVCGSEMTSISAGYWTALTHGAIASSFAFRSQWLEMLGIVTFIIEIQLRISFTRLFKSFMSILVMLWKRYMDTYFPIENFYIIPILVYVLLKWALIHYFFPTNLQHLRKQSKGRRDSFWFTVSKVSAYGYLVVLLLSPGYEAECHGQDEAGGGAKCSSGR